ncbi:MAG: DUF393 domain-containing protein [Pseudomonadota bacterium]
MTKTSTHVIYNARCPVCAAEIGHYRTYSEGRALPLVFHDLNESDLARWGLTADQAARRLYVVVDERLESGIPAFLILWRAMPRYRWLARLISLPGIRHLAVLIYDHLAAPLIYARFKRRQARLARQG